ncbi:MAG: biotin--[acetyl-CoA-carboxylase] ligase [Verrucomicrobia bacterium]|nr:MAG: biotin--[acetyl-CoA-carboxylase] ligase [Verrucomicrobiota bacterium]
MSGSDRPDRLVADELRAALGPCLVGNELVVVDETGSTNDLAWEAYSRGAPEGFVVFAERQTAGRGQYGRRWESGPFQGLLFSVVLRPRITLNESPQLTSLLAGATAATIIEGTGCAASIKTPNDIYAAGRKIAGVLVEGRIDRDGRYVAVAGVGVNVNQTLEDFPAELRPTAGSLRMAIGRKIPRDHLAVALLRKLEKDYLAFTRDG